jgi:hypothetical protein
MDDGALAGHDRDGPEGAVVLRRLRVDQIRQRDHHRGARVRIGGVDEPVHLLVAVREVDLEVAAALRDLGADVDVLEAVPVVVDHRLAVVDAVGPLTDHGAHLPLRPVENRLDGAVRLA